MSAEGEHHEAVPKPAHRGSPSPGKSTGYLVKATVRLYPLGQYLIVVNQGYIGLSKEYSFHAIGAILSGYRTIGHWFSIGSLTPILS